MKANPQIKLYKYDNSAFILIAVIDDYQQISFEHSLYSAGTFTVTINYNIPNARLFSRGLFVQFGNNPHDFGEILTMRNSIGPDGKGSEILNITGYDARYLFKRRIIRNLNANDVWAMTAKGEICLRSLVRSECGDGAESKRRLPISNVIPEPANAKGGVYSVSESYTNLYDALCTIATQSEIGWAVTFENGALTLEVFEGRDLKDSVFFSTDFESLANGEYTDTAESFANVLYIGGKGEGSEQDMYEGSVTDEGGNEPSALDRFEAYDSQSSMTTEEEYEAEAGAMLSQYSQNVTVSGAGLVKCPFVFRENYDVGDVITLRFSDKTAVTQILSVTEQWSKGSYTLSFSFGKPQNNLAQQISLLLKKISNASKKTKAIECVKWYTIPTDTAQSEADVTFDTLGFTGAMTENTTFTLYEDDEGTGSKNYNIYVKNLSGNFNLTLTTGKAGATDYILKSGTYNAQIYADEEGNIVERSITPINDITAESLQPATSKAISEALDGKLDNTLQFIQGSEVDSLSDSKIEIYKVQNYSIGWMSNDGFIINIPWSNNFAYQIAIDDQSCFLASRYKSSGVWSLWKTLSDTWEDDSDFVDITSQVNPALGVTSVKVIRKNNLVYMHITGNYTGVPTYGSQPLISNLPLKYRSSIYQTYAVVSYAPAAPYSYLSRVILERHDTVVLAETAIPNGGTITIGFMYMA